MRYVIMMTYSLQQNRITRKDQILNLCQELPELGIQCPQKIILGVCTF